MPDPLVEQHWPELAALIRTVDDLDGAVIQVEAAAAPQATPGSEGDAERGRQLYLDLVAYLKRTGRTFG